MALAGMGCASGPGGGTAGVPQAGDWQGSDLNFHVESGKVTAMTLVGKLQCTGDDGCKAEVPAGGLLGSWDTPPVAAPFAWQVTAAHGPLTLSGKFSSDALAAGTYTAKLGTCCAAVGAWSAAWVPGSTPTAASATTAGKTPPGWGAASSGTWHPAQPRAIVTPPLPAGVSADQTAAAQIWEKLRARLGLPAAAQAAALDAAAQKHAEFYVAHKAKYDSKKLSPHSEDPAFGEGFGGADPSTRAKDAGYSNPAVIEIMAFTGSASGAIAGWMETVYHRFPLVNPTTNEYGYGQAASAKAATEVINAAQVGGSGNVELVVYPWPGQTGVAAAWLGNEGPQPPKPPQGYPSGPVITARFTAGVEVKSHELFDVADVAVPHMWLDAKNDQNVAMFDAKTVVMYAHQPLSPGQHRVRLAVVRAGKDEVVQWTFVVGN